MFHPDPSPWQASAACAGLSPSVVFARRAKEAAPALRACAGCPVRSECEAAVAPAESYFDGVCAGRLWRNGRPADARRVAKALGLKDTGRVAKSLGPTDARHAPEPLDPTDARRTPEALATAGSGRRG
ncbi:WhiB family transcriptional regulator [Streptomyces vietnamensis]|uniref:WhiB family transcriptional regulator n=1 Tax=Streptomyces vietnamensis TaxID=362257 RepID=UPI0034330980